MDWTELVRKNEQCLEDHDPADMDLIVAKGIPALANIDIRHYVGIVDGYARAFEDWHRNEEQFYRTPHAWKNDINFFRLIALGTFLDAVVGIRYREDQRDVKKFSYTDPNDMFLTGILDNPKNGTCANMATLFVAICWRMSWPVGLAIAHWHQFCRYDDGKAKYNIETTNTGNGGVSAPEDDFYIVPHRISPVAIASGSDMTKLTHRQMLGLFVGGRGRYWYDKHDAQWAKRDFALALELYPQSFIFREMLDKTKDLEFLFGRHWPDRWPGARPQCQSAS